ncbi:MAG: formate dehydrogenase subunit gamma [Betaproteobacteria bacterium]|nr:formate dehydrogenase subunit gamma [Betaproteobacteria bacterium]
MIPITLNSIRRYGLLAAVALLLCGQQAGALAQSPPSDGTQAQRQQVQPYNNAPVWRDVRSEKEHVTTARGREAGVLIQSGGETWRQLRNGPFTQIGGWALALMVLLIAAFYKVKGTIRQSTPATGKKVQRFTNWERAIHWSSAISFCVLAISGLIILFGKYLLLPVIGYTLFAWLTQLAKGLHNFIGPLFMVCAVCLFLTFVGDNIPRAWDFIWVRKFGGLFSGEHVPAHRFNAGEKLWFWGGLSLLGIVVGASGLVLDFPNFDQSRATMQIANLIHLAGAVLFMLGALGHIYMGTLGVEGAYGAMRTGSVDEAWLKEHHDLWYEDYKAGKIAAPSSGAGAQGGDARTPAAPSH